MSSNSIPEDALNGTKVGTFSVINPRPGQTYTLSLVQANAVPFKIVGRDLILITGVPLDYETTNSTAIGVLISDSNGTTSQKMFEIRITSKVFYNEHHSLMLLFIHQWLRNVRWQTTSNFLGAKVILKNLTFTKCLLIAN